MPAASSHLRNAVAGQHRPELYGIALTMTQARTQFEHYQEATALQRNEERQAQERRIAQQDPELDRLRQHVTMLQSSAAEHRGQLAAVVAEKDLMREDLRAGQQAIAHMLFAKAHLHRAGEDPPM